MATFQFPQNNTMHIGLSNLNSDYKVYGKRSADAEKNKEVMYAAGLFIDHDQKVLLILDKQDGNADWVRYKIPGGVAENLENTQEKYFDALKNELVRMKFSNGLLNEIMQKEKTVKRTQAERTMILEMVEETGYYPVNHRYACDGYRFNKKNRKFDLWQVYFEVMEIVSPYSKKLNQPIKKISQVRTAKPIDTDVLNMRVSVEVEKAEKKVGNPNYRVPAQDAIQRIFSDKAIYYHSKGNEYMSKKFAFATANR